VLYALYGLQGVRKRFHSGRAASHGDYFQTIGMVKMYMLCRDYRRPASVLDGEQSIDHPALVVVIYYGDGTGDDPASGENIRHELLAYQVRYGFGPVSITARGYVRVEFPQ